MNPHSIKKRVIQRGSFQFKFTPDEPFLCKWIPVWTLVICMRIFVRQCQNSPYTIFGCVAQKGKMTWSQIAWIVLIPMYVLYFLYTRWQMGRQTIIIASRLPRRLQREAILKISQHFCPQRPLCGTQNTWRSETSTWTGGTSQGTGRQTLHQSLHRMNVEVFSTDCGLVIWNC